MQTTIEPRDLDEVRRAAEQEVPVVTFTMQRPEARLAVVGEASFQTVLERFSGGRDENGAIFRHHAAVLMPEPYNRYDHDAVSPHCDSWERPTRSATCRTRTLSPTPPSWIS
jgi:hypothetical protein